MIDMNVAGTVFAYGVTSSGKTHTMHVSIFNAHNFFGALSVIIMKIEIGIRLQYNHV